MKKTEKKFKRIYSPIKRKILLLLQAGLALGLTPSPKTHFYILKQLSKEWRAINRRYLYRIIREFHQERLVDWQEKADDSVKIVLTEKGRQKVLEFKIDELAVKKPVHWDGKWRIVFFDIPEKRRKARDALREKLKELGFYEIQKSVFIHPFPCRDEIDFIVEFFNIRPFVRYAEIINLINEAELKLKFDLV